MQKKIEDLEGERWSDIKGYEGLYKISSNGRVKSLVDRWRNNVITQNERLIKQNKIGNGYMGLQLVKKSTRHRVIVHILVATYFVPNPNNYPQVNHEDGNKLNNNDWNLRWGTAKYNINHAFDTGLNKKISINDKHRSKPIIQINDNNDIIAEFPSIMQVKRELNFAHSNISIAIKNKSKSYGYYWKFKTAI
ncbi:MAG TPA: NUMOD4 domain-containing protein [Chitinophagales bacterium]|nr:NUMOD4 domain-containing protein [Chitinophagales bacterium]